MTRGCFQRGVGASAVVLLCLLAYPSSAEDPSNEAGTVPAAGTALPEADQEGAATAQSSTTDESDADPELKLKAKQWAAAFFFGVLLLIILIAGSLAIIHFSRRFRQYIRADDEERPTASEDVWAMHKLPDRAVVKDEDEDPFEPDDPDSDDAPGPTR